MTLGVHESLFDTVWNYPLPDSTADLFPGITLCPQHLQDQYPTRNETRFRLSPHASDQTRTDTWEIPDDSLVRNINTQWAVSTMGQPPSCECSAPRSHKDEVYGDDLITEYFPSLMPSIMPQIELPTTEFSGITARHTIHLPQHFSNPYYQSAISPCPSLSPLGPNLAPEGPSKSLAPVHTFYFVDDWLLMTLQAVGQRSSQECHDFWKKIPEDAIIITGSDKFVPQALYRPLTRADKERYLELVHLSPPIIFLTKEPFEWGIPLEDVHNGKTQRLIDKDDPVLQNCGPSVSIRINWPGYSSFRRRIPSRNWRKTKGPITKEKLARSLAKIISQFIQEMSPKPLEVDADINWRVGTQHIKLEDLILVSLHHVSKGSWQPQFRLRHSL